MAMHNLNLLTNENLSQQRERAEHCRESRASIDHPVRKMIDFDAVREISDACARRRVVRMGDDDYTMAAVNQFLRRTKCQLLSYRARPSHYGRKSNVHVTRSAGHVRTTADICDSQRHLAAGKRNPKSFYICQRLELQ